MDPQQRDRFGRLKRWREVEAGRRGIGLQAVLPTAVLKDLIVEPPTDKTLLAENPRIGKARAERYGEEIMKIVGTPEQ
jgi:ribonuclease D